MADDRTPSLRRPQSPPPQVAPVPGDRVQEYLAHLLVNAALPQHRDRVLDVACGPGYVLLELESRVGAGGRVVGIDESPERLAPAQGWQTGAHLRHVELYAMDPRKLVFPSSSFTLVTCGQALHRLADPLAVLREMYRVLHSGGWIAVTVPHPDSGETLRESLARRAAGLPALPPPAAEAPAWDEGYIGSLLTQAGFPTVHVQVVRQHARFADAAQWWHSGSANDPFALPSPESRLTQALQAWQGSAKAQGLDVPLVTIVAIARKGSGAG